MAQPKITVPETGVWDCPWYNAEAGLVHHISDKVIWWAIQAAVGSYDLVKVVVESKPDSERESPLERHLNDEGYGHTMSMADLLTERRKMLGCPDALTLLSAALGDAEAWRKWHDHQRWCLGSCNSQVEHLQRYTAELAVYRRMELR